MSPAVTVFGPHRPLQSADDPIPVDLPDAADPLWQASEFLIAFLVVLLLGWVVLEPVFSRVVRRRNRNNPTLSEALTRYVRLIVLIFALFVGFSVAGFSDVVSNSTLVIAAVTIALGVAGQSVIGSLVSGVALVVDPQFNIGNYIRWSDGEGEVTSITLRVTRVQTPAGALVTIPNTTLTDEGIVRPFERNRCRTDEYVEIAYEDDIERALSVLEAITADIDQILSSPPPRVGVDELGGDGVVLRVQFWVEDPIESMLPVRSAFARAAKTQLDAAGIEISPASQRDLEGKIHVSNPV